MKSRIIQRWSTAQLNAFYLGLQRLRGAFGDEIAFYQLSGACEQELNRRHRERILRR